MDGVKFTEKIIINCAAEAVFNYTQDHNQRLSWDSFLKSAALMDSASQAAKGTRAYCVAKNGLGMITEYVSCNRPKATAIKMTKGPYLFKSFLGSWNFKKIENLQTEVVFLYSFTLRFPFTLVTPFIKRNLASNVRQRLISLKTHLESSSNR